MIGAWEMMNVEMMHAQVAVQTTIEHMLDMTCNALFYGGKVKKASHPLEGRHKGARAA